MKIVYTAHATAAGGRKGHVETDDKNLVLELQELNPIQPKPGPATNPEQLFACAYAACFGSAIEAVARAQNIDVSNVSVRAHVSLIREAKGGFHIAAELETSIPGISPDVVKKLVSKAHQLCPYSKAMQGNIDVELKTAA